jgi:putative SOS response-associated peptidase YedK
VSRGQLAGALPEFDLNRGMLDSNELVKPIHDRMAVIIVPIEYDRWLSPLDPDPRDLLVPFPSEPMTMWPISTRVNKPENDDPSILERVNEPVFAK